MRCTRTLGVPLIAGAFALGVGAPAGAAVPEPVLGPPVLYGTTAAATGDALADIDNDGVLDQLTALDDATMLVALGVGDGTFGLPSRWSTVEAASALETADLDRDGNLDAVLSTTSSSTATVLMGNGDGSFDAAVQFTTGSLTKPIDVALADVNDDGSTDIVTLNSFNAGISALLNDGSGGFGEPIVSPLAATEPAVTVTLGDLSGGGDIDAVIAVPGESALYVMPGQGDGSFTTGSPFDTGGQPQGATLADLDDDGRLDAAAPLDTPGGVSVMRGKGDGSFGAPSVQSMPTATTDVAVGDLNGDTIPDLVAAATDSTVGVLAGRGGLDFKPATTFPAGLSAGALAVGDLTGQGMLDVTAVGDTDFAVLLNQTPPTIDSVTPARGPSAGGTTVRVRGTGFGTEPEVTFGANPGTDVNVLSQTRLRVKTPAGTPGRADVTVTRPDQESATLPRAFTYCAPPVSPAPLSASYRWPAVQARWSGTACVYRAQLTSIAPGASARTRTAMAVSTSVTWQVVLTPGTRYTVCVSAGDGATWSLKKCTPETRVP